MGERPPRRESSVQRIVGLSKKPEMEKGLLDVFERQAESREQLPHEREKSIELVEAIGQANSLLKEFFLRYGLSWQEIPPEKIHLVPGTEKKKTEGGKFDPLLQDALIFISERPENRLPLLTLIVHEMIHANTFFSLERVKENAKASITFQQKDEQGYAVESISLRERRGGLVIRARTDRAFLWWLNEALTEELAARFDNEYFPHIPFVAEEFSKRETAIQSAFPNPADAERRRRYVTSAKTEKKDGETVFHYDERGYKAARLNLEAYIHELYEKNRETFTSKDDVFALFVRSAWDGNLFPIARLIEKTNGKGSFRKLAEQSAAELKKLSVSKK